MSHHRRRITRQLAIVTSAAGLGALGSDASAVPMAPLVAIVAIGFAAPALASGGPGEFAPKMLLSTMLPLAEEAPEVTAAHAWAQLAWLAALTVGIGALSLRIDPSERARRG